MCLVATAAALPLHRFRSKSRTAVPALVLLVATIGAVGYTAMLVFSATAAVGSPEAALLTLGGLLDTSVTLPFALVAILIGLSLGRLEISNARSWRSRQWVAETVIGLSALLALVIKVPLIVSSSAEAQASDTFSSSSYLL